MPLAPGDRLGPYEIVAPIGAGGMGDLTKRESSRPSVSHDGRQIALFARDSAATALQITVMAADGDGPARTLGPVGNAPLVRWMRGAAALLSNGGPADRYRTSGSILSTDRHRML